MSGMWYPRLQNGPDAPSLEANAASAGLALACAYSSSEEYEAEVIQVRRKAGVYGFPHHRQVAAAFAVAVAVGALVLAQFIVND